VDGTVSLWNPASGNREPSLEPATAHGTALCPISLDGRPVVAVASELAIRLWDPATGRILRSLHSTEPLAAFQGLCAVPVDGRELLASADDQGTLQLWNPSVGHPIWAIRAHDQVIATLCAVASGDRWLIASGGADHAVRLTEPGTGGLVHLLDGHAGRVTGLCTAPWKGRRLLVSTSEDRTVRLWDPDTGAPVLTIPVYRSALSCVFATDRLVVGLDAGLLALELG
jgi:WD40 repeat protein